MRILVAIPILALVGTIVPLAIFGLNDLQHDLNVSRLQDEIRITGGQFALIVDDLSASAASLASNTQFIDAAKNGDPIEIRSFLTSNAIEKDLNYVEFELCHAILMSVFGG